MCRSAAAKRPLVALPESWSDRSRSRGIRGHVRVDLAVTFAWIWRSRSPGFGGHVRVESAVTFRWNPRSRSRGARSACVVARQKGGCGGCTDFAFRRRRRSGTGPPLATARGLGAPRRTEVQGAVRAEIVVGHRAPPSPRLGIRRHGRAVQSRPQAENPDASLSAQTDGDIALAARHVGAVPTASADTSRRPVAAIPVVSAFDSPPRSTPVRDHSDCKSGTDDHSEHSHSAAAPTAPRSADSASRLPASDDYDSVPRGRPWVVPGRLHATRIVLSTIRVAPPSPPASTTSPRWERPRRLR